MRLSSIAGLAVACILGVAPSATARDSDQIRGYLQARAGVFLLTDTDFIPGVNADRFADAYGVTLGVNLNRYVSVEVAGDLYEPAINFGSGTPFRAGSTIAEYKVWTLIPQVRLRYPLLDGRLTPYMLGGVGVSFTQINDRKPAAFGIALAGSNTSVAGSLGVGIEYFLLDNVALGLETKYVFSGDHDLRVGPMSGKANPSALLTTVGFRVLWPETRSEEADARPPAEREDTGRVRGYVQARVGGAFFPDTSLAGNVETDVAQVGFGVSIGVDLNRYLGVELSADTTEADLNFAGQGKFSEYALWSVIPQVRVRYPLLGGVLVPYAVGGVGIGWTETSDSTPRAENLVIRAKGTSVVGSIGAGVDYFIASNLAVGLDLKYLIFGGQPFTIEGVVSGKVNPKPLFTTVGLRVFFP